MKDKLEIDGTSQ